MLTRIKANLTRQSKALEVLDDLLQEEFTHLMERRPQEVTQLEFSIHELLRQVAAERLCLKNELAERSVRVLADALPEAMADEASELKGLADAIERLEQRCSRQASSNAELVLALMDQGQDMLEFLHEKIAPSHKDTYARSGRLARTGTTQARLLSGRL
ncbi:MAG: flagellar export chaperone FlgN [Desulfovibrionaceae bacterium]|jgi:flagellar biosynthesis/type III secretory pathway chaperone|nr:flagellar export chaperone FlgN [Desulfovibrionaceae bacterium]